MSGSTEGGGMMQASGSAKNRH